jgi:hypothetical protein
MSAVKPSKAAEVRRRPVDIEQAPQIVSDATAAPVSGASSIGGEARAAILVAVSEAVSNGASTMLGDDMDRQWFVCPDTVNNNSTVLIRVTKGLALAYRNVSTATLVNTQVAEDAIDSLDGELR